MCKQPIVKGGREQRARGKKKGARSEWRKRPC